MADDAAPAPEPEPEAGAKVKRLPEPDKESHQAAVEALHGQIAEKKARLDAIRDQIEEKNLARKGVRDGSSSIRDQLKEVRGRRNAKIEEKKAIRAQMQALKRVELPSKKDQPRMNPDQIAGKIAQLEHRQQTEAMTILEEKDLMKELKTLRASVAEVKKFSVNIEDLKVKKAAYDMDRKSLSAMLTELDGQIDEIKAEEDKIIAKLDVKNAAADQAGNGIPELIEERDKMRPEIPAIYDQIKALKAEFKKENDKWWEADRAYRAQERAEQQAKWEAQKDKRAAEYEEQRKFRMEEAAALVNDDPHINEKDKCDALCSYLQTLLPESATAAVAEKAIDHGGMTVMSKKHLEEEEFMASLKKPKKKKGKKGGAQTKANMTHPHARLSAMHDMGIEVPNDLEAVAAAIEKVKEIKQGYVDKAKNAPKAVVREYRPLVCRVRISPSGDKDIKLAIEAI